MTWIQTVSGKKFSLHDPCPTQIDIEDIAHSLAMLCRFNGHGLKYYSVAEHSLHVCDEVRPELALVGLLHDAAEAYLGDVPSPLKKFLPDFKQFEKRVEIAIADRFGVSWQEFGNVEIKRADLQLLVDEKTSLMVSEPEPWFEQAPEPKYPARIMCWSPGEAKSKFLDRFYDLAN